MNTYTPRSHNPRRINTYVMGWGPPRDANLHAARNPFKICTYKNSLHKLFRISSYKKARRGSPPLALSCERLSLLGRHQPRVTSHKSRITSHKSAAAPHQHGFTLSRYSPLATPHCLSNAQTPSPLQPPSSPPLLAPPTAGSSPLPDAPAWFRPSPGNQSFPAAAPSPGTPWRPWPPCRRQTAAHLPPWPFPGWARSPPSPGSRPRSQSPAGPPH